MSSLTTGQQAFVSRLAADTGLNSGVIAAWTLAEESGTAATARQAAGNHDWLNIGYTDSGTYGAAAAVWRNPIAAADATAGWLKGRATIPGYGTASSGVRSILSAVGKSPAAQIAAIQGSGWASSGYPSLPSIFSSVAGSAPAPSSSSASSPSSSSSASSGGSYGGLGGFLLKLLITVALLGAGVALGGVGLRGMFRSRAA